MKLFLLPAACLIFCSAKAQLVIDNASFFIGEGAVVTVQGNLTSNVSIQAGGAGANQGKIQMKGGAVQTITLGAPNVVIPHLEIDNGSNVMLSGSNDLRVENRLAFVNGKLQLGNRNLILPDNISIDGATAARFIETNGTGEARQLVPANTAGKILPIGTGNNYTPATYAVSGASFGAGAYVGVRATGTEIPVPARHPRTESYLSTAWNVTRSGITGGTVNVQGTYVDAQITGTEADLVGMYWNGTTWALAGSSQNAGTNTVGANVAPEGGVVYGMNKFLLANVKTYLQGSYASGGLMRDQLRTTSLNYAAGNPPTNNLLPLSDPYRGADFNANAGFAHVNNGVAETIAASVLNNTPNVEDNIVDWVFIELRTNATPSTVLQTRAALIQRDGDIVDIDGVSNVYFKNVDAGSYNIAVKHRNHLGIRTATAQAINLTQPVGLLNMSNAAANHLNSFAANLGGGLFGLYGGNANRNTNTRITGADAIASDFEFLKTDLGGLAIKNNVYATSDVNMNRNSRISGADATASDFEFIKVALGGAAIRTQPSF